MIFKTIAIRGLRPLALGTSLALTLATERRTNTAKVIQASAADMRGSVRAQTDSLTLTPCFRTERSHSWCHLAELWILEAKAAFISNLNDVMDMLEGSWELFAKGPLSEVDADQGG